MKQKKIIIIGVDLILLIIIITFVIVIINNKNTDNTATNSKENSTMPYVDTKKIKNDIKNTFTTAEKLNDLFTSEDLGEESNYVNDLENECYAYIGRDVIEQIKKIRDVYILDEYITTFEIESGDNNEVLYICPPKNCRRLDIDLNNIEIVSYEKREINAKIDNYSYYFRYDGNKLKLLTEAIKCDLYYMLHGDDNSQE